MATPPFNINPTAPQDNDFASQFPSNERASRDNTKSWLEVDHDDCGKHKQSTYVTTASISPSTGQAGVYFDGSVMRVQVGAGAAQQMDVFPAGTRMPFMQAAPPAGWVLDTTANDKVLRVNTTSGGGTGGSWTITGLTVPDHTLSIAELPAHTHPNTTPSGPIGTLGLGPPSAVAAYTTFTNSGSAGSGSPHNHGSVAADSAWRPAYVDVVIGVKA